MPFTLSRRFGALIISSGRFGPATQHATGPGSIPATRPAARGGTVGWPETASGVAVAGVATLDLLLGGVAVGGFLDHRAEHALVRLVPVGTHHPLAAVPRVNARPRRAHVVLASGLDRADHALHTQLFKPLLVEVEVLETPAHLLTGHDLALAELLLRRTHGLDAEHRDDHAAGVEHRTDLVARARTLAGVMHLLQEVLHQRVLGAVGVERQRAVTLGVGAHVLDV